MLNKIPLLENNYVLRNEPFGALLYNCKNKKEHIYNLLASEILTRCNGQNTIREIIEDIKYLHKEISYSNLKKDIIDFISNEKEKNVLKINNTYNNSEDIKIYNNNYNSNVYYSFPKFVLLNITNKCNLNCKHCFLENNKNKRKTVMGLQKFKDIIKYLSDHGLLHLQISGGEPFMSENIFEILNYAKNNIPKVSLTTNGIFINKNKAKKLKKLNIDNIQISIDGIKPIHNKIRNSKNAFDAAITGIKNLLKYDNNIITSTVVNNLNIGVLKKTINYLSNIGVTQCRVEPLMLLGNAKKNKNLKISKWQYRKAYLNLRKIKNRNVKIIFGEGFRQFEFYKNKKPEYRNRFCQVGIAELLIDSNGDFYPCPGFVTSNFKIGNIFRNDLLEMWNNSKILDQFKNLTVDKIEGCSSCDYKNYCGGGCRAIAYHNTGYLNSKYPFCIIKERIYDKY